VKYDAEEAFKFRRKVLDVVCQSYSDLYVPELASAASAAELEPARNFLNGRNLSYCIPSFPSSSLIASILQQAVDDEADKAEDTIDPCGRLKLKDPQSECDIGEQLNKVGHRFIAVQHPLEKVASFYEDKKNEAGLAKFLREELSFEALARALVARHDLIYEEYPTLAPYSYFCHMCAKGFRPTEVIKVERAGADMATAFAAAGMQDLADAAGLRADAGSAETAFEPSKLAKESFSQLPRSMVVDLFEVYRSDHELFGYDPSPFMKLTFDGKG